MRIGGLTKVSTLDYPGILSAAVFLTGCNFRCPYCHNPDLVRPAGEASASPEKTWDEAGVLAFLETRARYLGGVAVSGGEPTLSGGLPEFLGRVKALGFRVKLDTNGSRPEALSRLLEERLVDYVALDLKSDPACYPPDLAPPSESAPVMETLGILKRLDVPREYRTTCAAPFVNDASIEAIARAAEGEAPLYLQPFRPERTLDPAFMARHPVQPGREDLARFRELASKYLPCHIR